MATPPRNAVTMSPSGPARLNECAADAADQPDVVWSNRPRVLDIKNREQLSLPNIGQLNNNAQCEMMICIQCGASPHSQCFA